MTATEVSIWVGMGAGCILVVLFVIITLIRTIRKERILGNELIMLALAAVFIVGSQYSRIKVAKILELEKEVNELRGSVTLSELEKISLSGILKASKAETDTLFKELETTRRLVERATPPKDASGGGGSP